MEIAGCPIDINDLIIYPPKTDYYRLSSLINVQTVNQNLKECDSSFELFPHQKTIINYFSSYSPYRSILLFNDVGTGKTISVISIIELRLMTFLDENRTKVLILVPNKIIRDVFIKELLGKTRVNNKVVYVKKSTGNKYINDELRNRLNKCDEKTRKRLEKKILKEKIFKYYEITTHKKWERYINTLTDEQIKKKYHSWVIVSDEIQKAKNSKSNYFKVLDRVISLTTNTYLILLSATPMIDSVTEICQPINLLLKNEKLDKELKPKDIINFFSENEKERQEAKLKILDCTKGLISRVYGRNPEYFPKKVDMDENFQSSEENDMKVHYVYLTGEQLLHYLVTFMEEFLSNEDLEPNEMWNKCRRACRYFEDEDGNIISVKFDTSYEIGKKSKGKGVNVVYCFFVKEGLNPFEKYLKKKNISSFDGKYSDGYEEKYFNFSNPPNEYIFNKAVELCATHDNNNGGQMQWVLGSRKVSQGIPINDGENVIFLEGGWNMGNQTQFIGRLIRIGTHEPTANECGEFVVNKNVYVWRLCSRIRMSDIQKLNPMFVKRFEMFIKTYYKSLCERGFIDKNDKSEGELGRLLTIDEYIYGIALKKEKEITEMEIFLRKNAFHCVDLSNNDLLKNKSHKLSYENEIFKLFTKQPIYHLKEIEDHILKKSNFLTNILYETLNNLIETKFVFKGYNKKNGIIVYMENGYYLFKRIESKVSEVVTLEDFVKPIINIDNFFLIKDVNDPPTDYEIPLKLDVSGIEDITNRLYIKLKKGHIYGVYANTENNPELYQLKICGSNKNESVCGDKSVEEIYRIGKTVGLVDVKTLGKNRKLLSKKIGQHMMASQKVLPWSVKHPPSNYEIYCMARAWGATELVKFIEEFEEKLTKKYFKDWVQLFVDLIQKKVANTQNLTHNHTKDIIKQFNEKLEKYPHLTLRLLAQMRCRKPKRFDNEMWSIIQQKRQYFESIFAQELNKIQITMYKFIKETFFKK